MVYGLRFRVQGLLLTLWWVKASQIFQLFLFVEGSGGEGDWSAIWDFSMGSGFRARAFRDLRSQGPRMVWGFRV